MLERQLVKKNIAVVNTASFVIQGNIKSSVWNVGQLAELKVRVASYYYITQFTYISYGSYIKF